MRDARARGFQFHDFNPSGGPERTPVLDQTFGARSALPGVPQQDHLAGGGQASRLQPDEVDPRR